MVRKTQTKDKTNSTNSNNKVKSDKSKGEAKSDVAKEDEKDTFTVLIKSKANKISPKSDGSIEFELVKDKEGILYLRLTGNSSSGNFCKSPVTLQSIIDVLNKQGPDKIFTSKVMKDVFQGKGSKNSNNRSFLMATLRSKDMGLTIADKEKPMSSKLSEVFKSQSDKLLAMS